MPGTAIIEEMRERMREALKHRQITQRQLARLADLGENVVGNILSGRTENPETGTFLALLAALQVNSHWIVTGQEPRYTDESAMSSGTVTAIELPVDRWLQSNAQRLQVTEQEARFLRKYPWPQASSLPDDVFEATLSHHRITERRIVG